MDSWFLLSESRIYRFLTCSRFWDIPVMLGEMKDDSFLFEGWLGKLLCWKELGTKLRTWLPGLNSGLLNCSGDVWGWQFRGSCMPWV